MPLVDVSPFVFFHMALRFSAPATTYISLDKKFSRTIVDVPNFDLGIT